jgi:cell division septum initiation protein DivIVA
MFNRRKIDLLERQIEILFEQNKVLKSRVDSLEDKLNKQVGRKIETKVTVEPMQTSKSATYKANPNSKTTVSYRSNDDNFLNNHINNLILSESNADSSEKDSHRETYSYNKSSSYNDDTPSRSYDDDYSSSSSSSYSSYDSGSSGGGDW